MTAFNPKETYDKFRNGDSLSDDEVAEGIDFFGDLSEKLMRCGPAFSLAANEFCRVTIAFHQFQSARQECAQRQR